jgi:hypothetical protein
MHTLHQTETPWLSHFGQIRTLFYGFQRLVICRRSTQRGQFKLAGNARRSRRGDRGPAPDNPNGFVLQGVINRSRLIQFTAVRPLDQWLAVYIVRETPRICSYCLHSRPT